MEVIEPFWSLGTLIAFPIGALLTIVALAVMIASMVWFRRSRDDHRRSDIGWLIVMAAAVALIAGGLTSYFMWPFTVEHHQWQPASGTVETIDKRIVGGADSIEERFVVTFEGDGQQYACDDTRCATVRPADDLSLACKREWEYAATDGYGCRFVDYRSN